MILSTLVVSTQNSQSYALNSHSDAGRGWIILPIFGILLSPIDIPNIYPQIFHIFLHSAPPKISFFIPTYQTPINIQNFIKYNNCEISNNSKIANIHKYKNKKHNILLRFGKNGYLYSRVFGNFTNIQNRYFRMGA